MRRFILLVLILISLCLTARPGYADCTSPPGKEADIVYNLDYHTYQFCNGTDWKKYQSGFSLSQQSTYNPTIAPGSGFFVMSSTTWDGNLGGLSGADSKCLTELTTNTGWKGYSTANSNGQLIAGKVKAFLCDGGCNNLTASTTYNFANAGSAEAGGATFTTDSSGLGPNDTANWAAANYFSGTYTYWSSRNWSGASTWLSGAFGSFCSTYTSSSSGDNGSGGTSSSESIGRWAYSDSTCDNARNLICFVDP